jgi:hypothetical protein
VISGLLLVKFFTSPSQGFISLTVFAVAVRYL